MTPITANAEAKTNEAVITNEANRMVTSSLEQSADALDLHCLITVKHYGANGNLLSTETYLFDVSDNEVIGNAQCQGLKLLYQMAN